MTIGPSLTENIGLLKKVKYILVYTATGAAAHQWRQQKLDSQEISRIVTFLFTQVKIKDEGEYKTTKMYGDCV